MASVVQYLEWCSALIADVTDGHQDLTRAAQPDRDLVAETAVVLRQVGDLLADPDGAAALPDVNELERRREASAAYDRSAAAAAAVAITTRQRPRPGIPSTPRRSRWPCAAWTRTP